MSQTDRNHYNFAKSAFDLQLFLTLTTPAIANDWSLKTLNESLQAKRGLPDIADYSKAVTLNNLSVVQKELGDQKSSLKSEKESLELWSKFLGNKSTKQDASTLYKAVLKKTKPEYEVPNYDTRTELLISGEGRI